MPQFTVIALQPAGSDRYYRFAQSYEATDAEMAQVVLARADHGDELLIAGVAGGSIAMVDQALYADETG